MEMVKFDEQSDTVTLALTRMEFVAIHSVFSGVVNTYKFQDPRIIGVPPDELKQVYGGLGEVLKQLVSKVCK